MALDALRQRLRDNYASMRPRRVRLGWLSNMLFERYMTELSLQ